MKNSKARTMCALSLFTALICVGAYVKIPLALPVTLQLLFTNTAALTLGRKGALSSLLYLLLGLVGLPVFSSGGGIGSILSLSFGFNIGFIAGAFFAGLISEKNKNTRTLALASAVNMLCVYACGMVYFLLIQKLYLTASATLPYALGVCVLPFVLPDMAKCAVSIILARRIRLN